MIYVDRNGVARTIEDYFEPPRGPFGGGEPAPVPEEPDDELPAAA